MSGCEHLCSTYDIQLELECFLSGKRERISTVEPVRYVSGEHIKTNTTGSSPLFASTYDTVPR